MSKSDKNLILLFLNIVLPIVFIIFISSFVLLNTIETKKKELMYEKVQSMAKLISAIYLFDLKYSKENDFNYDNNKATISQIQTTFQNLNSSQDLNFTYLLGKKTDKDIEYLAFSTDNKPHPIKMLDISKAQSMRDALEGMSSVQIKIDNGGIKVFSAYTNIPKTKWALVIQQPYTEHIKIFHNLIFYIILVILTVLTILFFILRHYERKNNLLIKESEDRFKHLVESTYDWVWEVDYNGVYTYASPQIESILGYKPNYIVGKTPFDFMPKEESTRLIDIFAKIVKAKKPIINLENINIHKNGQKVILLTNGTPFYNSIGKLLGYRGIDKDITTNKAQEQMMEKLAYFDQLTGLANRKNIINRIEEELLFALRNKTNSAVIFLDLDGFKHINDSLGHNYGDEVLKIVSLRIKECVREFDIVGRFGGDEFIILVRGKEDNYERCKEHTSKLANRIISSINQPIKLNNSFYTIGISLGVTFIPEDGINALEIIKRADTAMYRAKELGKNCTIFYDSFFQTEADKILHIKSEILSGFKNEEFVIYYQAQYDVDGRNILGYESLIRWQHKIKGLLSPSEFIPYINKFNLNFELDTYVCNKIYEDLHKITSNDSNLNIAINISAKSFENNNFINFLKDKVNNNNLDASKITFEITEDTLLNIVDNSFIDQIIELGFKLSIDDFGTGYSKLSYLSSIKYSEIKIDKSFIQGAVNNSKDKKICKLILNMYKELNVRIVAEGVETQEQLNFIKSLGINVIQGYLYAKPEPLNNIFI